MEKKKKLNLQIINEISLKKLNWPQENKLLMT